MNVDFPLLQALVRRVIEDSVLFSRWLLEEGSYMGEGEIPSWTVQGFGMMRLNLEKIGRIHIWDQRLRVPGMNSDIHTHPWHLRSLVISGELFNSIYEKTTDAEWPWYHTSKIQTGEGGGLVNSLVRGGLVNSLILPETVRLRLRSHNQYLPGEFYEQEPSVIHQTELHPRNPIVTLIRRDKGAPDEKAEVYWPAGQKWMTAEPRPATVQEVIDVCEAALKHWG